MVSDDILAYLAKKPKRDRPTELRSDAKMLWVWLRLRDDKEFRSDVLCRHGLHSCAAIDEDDLIHEHAVSNAWGHCMQVLMQEMAGERLIERKWQQNSADLGGVPRRHFRSNQLVRGASLTSPVRYRWSRNGGRMVTSVVLAQKVELRGGRSCCPRSK